MSDTNKECTTFECTADRLPHMVHCYEHVPRYEIPPYDEIECPHCGATGGHGTLSDSRYYCGNDSCGELFDPRRTDYLERKHTK